MTKAGGNEFKSTLYCSFCGKSQHEVRKLIAGPAVFICDECVEFAWTLLAKNPNLAGEIPRRRAYSQGNQPRSR